MSATKLKKSVGKIILKINSEILELQSEYKKSKDGTEKTKKADTLEKSVKEKKDALEKTLKELENRPNYVQEENMQKTVQMIRNNIETASAVLGGDTEISESDVQSAEKAVNDVLAEIENCEQLNESVIGGLVDTIATLTEENNSNIGDSADGQFERELEAIGTYQKERFRRMEKIIISKMTSHKDDLKKKWNEKKDSLDHQALKEFRNEFESTHKQLNFMVSEWDRRKLSDILSDYLMDLIGSKFEEYMTEYKVMDEEKRLEAAAQRIKNL